MTLDDLLNLRGLALARAFMREVLRCDERVPSAVPHMVDDAYSHPWACRTWNNVRRRYNQRAPALKLPLVAYDHTLEGLDATPPYRVMTLSFTGFPKVHLQVSGRSANDLFLLAGLHLYIRMVHAGAVKPRDSTLTPTTFRH